MISFPPLLVTVYPKDTGCAVMLVIVKETPPVGRSSTGQSPRPTVTVWDRSKRASVRPSDSATLRDCVRREVCGVHGDGQVIAQHAPSSTRAAATIITARERDAAAFTLRNAKTVAHQAQIDRISIRLSLRGVTTMSPSPEAVKRDWNFYDFLTMYQRFGVTPPVLEA